MKKLFSIFILMVFVSCAEKIQEEIIKTNTQQMIDLDKADASFDKSWRDLS
jgi:hypothetical protein